MRSVRWLGGRMQNVANEEGCPRSLEQPSVAGAYNAWYSAPQSEVLKDSPFERWSLRIALA
jgi:hypothetical protein